MKKCPKCKAEIQEEARFCLYCMTSFEEKQTIENPKANNKRWLYIIAAVLAVVLVVISIVLFAPKFNDSNDYNNNSNSSSFSSDSNTSADKNDTTSSEQQAGADGASGISSSPSSNSQTSNSSNNITNNTSGNTTNNNSQNGSTNSKTTNNTSTNTSRNSTTGGIKTETDSSNMDSASSTNSTASDATNSTPTNTQPKYSYIEATIENAYPTGYSAMYAPENAIVITKVNYKEESGNYVIPDTIDGKKVAAIMPSAFSDSSISLSVKSVTLPATVRTIWGDAFKNCLNLTDLYIKSTVIGIYENAFPASVNRNGKITFHCKRDCRDFDFYYYRNIANKYDAEYEEWNG